MHLCIVSSCMPYAYHYCLGWLLLYSCIRIRSTHCIRKYYRIQHSNVILRCKLVQFSWQDTKCDLFDPWQCLLIIAARKSLLVCHETFVSFLEPFNGFFLCDLLGLTNICLARLALAHSSARPGQDDVKVHSIDAGWRIVFDPQIDVLIDSKAKATCYDNWLCCGDDEGRGSRNSGVAR